MKQFLSLLFLLCGLVCNGQIISTYVGSGTAGFGGDGGPASTAMLHNPSDIAPDSLGNLYINDYSNRRIRKVSTAGIISTVAGCCMVPFSGHSFDGSMATADTLDGITGMMEMQRAIYTCGQTYIPIG